MNIQKGDIEHRSNNEIILITADNNNIKEYSRVYRISSSTPNKDIVYAAANYGPHITCSLDSDYNSNSRSGAIIINFVDVIPDFVTNSVILVLAFSNFFDNKPKVHLTMYSPPAEITTGVYPYYWVIPTTEYFSIYMTEPPVPGQTIKFFYTCEG